MSAADLVLQPATEWKVDRLSDKCRLRRSFGAGENATTLLLDQGGVEPSYTVTIIGKPLRHPHGTVVRAQFGPVEQPTSRGYVSAKSRGGKPALLMYGVLLAPIAADAVKDGRVAGIGTKRESAITEFTVSRAVVKPFTLALGSMGEPFADLHKCAAQVATQLEMAGRVKIGQARPPEPDRDYDDWIRAEDYPMDLLSQGMEALIHVRLTVNESGRASSCHIATSNRPQMFDDVVCLRLIQRGRFKPALDAHGEPRAAYYTTAVRFSIP